jgi:hypothetical protein
MAKMCTDCGAPIYAQWNVCAECGAPVLINRKISRRIQGGEKIRRLRISIIITMIIGLVIVLSQYGIGFSYQKYNLAEQELWRAADRGTITWAQYDNRRNVLEDQNSLEVLILNNIAFIAGIAIQIAFMLVILGFLSISFDTVFKEKTRRIYLIITSAFILFYFYLIFTVLV